MEESTTAAPLKEEAGHSIEDEPNSASTIGRITKEPISLSDIARASSVASANVGATDIQSVPTIAAATKPASFSGAHYERTFLTYQRQLREGGTYVLNEAMLVLDIIDTKANSLLAYISISLAALVFLLTSLDSNSNLNLVLISKAQLSVCLLAVLMALLTAIILCLSCLNIIGAHTIKKLTTSNKLSFDTYEELIVKVTSSRRRRYLFAHHISMATAAVSILIFALLLGGAVAALLAPTTPKDVLDLLL